MRGDNVEDIALQPLMSWIHREQAVSVSMLLFPEQICDVLKLPIAHDPICQAFWDETEWLDIMSKRRFEVELTSEHTRQTVANPGACANCQEHFNCVSLTRRLDT